MQQAKKETKVLGGMSCSLINLPNDILYFISLDSHFRLLVATLNYQKQNSMLFKMHIQTFLIGLILMRRQTR